MRGTSGTSGGRVQGRCVGAAPLLVAMRPYVGAGLVSGVALIAALAIEKYLSVANVALVFLAGVVFCATRWGLLPALLAGGLGVLALNYFVFPPLHDLAVEDPENVVAILVFVGVAALVGRLAARARADAELARRRAEVTEELYAFARQLTRIDDLDAMLRMTARKIADALGVNVVLLLAEQAVPQFRVAVPPGQAIDPADLAHAERTLRADDPAAGLSSDPPSDPSQGPGEPSTEARWLFLPLRAVGGIIGVLGLSKGGLHPPRLTDESRRFVEAIGDQVAVAIERSTLAEDVQRARVAAETESLRSAMLSAISHDLKTPLASILGAATSLGTYSSYFEQQERDDLVGTIREEAERMSCFVANLLDITRVEAGTLEVRAEATDIGEVIGAAARRARRILGDRRLALRIAPDLPMLEIDGVLLEQVLFNLLDNAAKYSPPQSTITVESRGAYDRILIKVVDEGPGIHPQESKLIFEKFFRSAHGRRQRAGTGLGLAICRGFVEAMGGKIIAGNRTDRPGAVFMIGFPRPPAPRLPPVLDD